MYVKRSPEGAESTNRVGKVAILDDHGDQKESGEKESNNGVTAEKKGVKQTPDLSSPEHQKSLLQKKNGL